MRSAIRYTLAVTVILAANLVQPVPDRESLRCPFELSATPAAAKALGYDAFAKMTVCDGKPAIAFRSWYTGSGIENGDLIVATPTTDAPESPADWQLIKVGNGAAVATNDERWPNWLAVTEIGGDIACAYVRQGDGGNLGVCRSTGNDPVLGSSWRTYDITPGATWNWSAVALADIEGVPFITVADSYVRAGDSAPVSNLQICWAMTQYPEVETDWSILTACSLPGQTGGIGCYRLAAIEADGKPAVFFYVVERGSYQLFVAAPTSPEPGLHNWKAVALFPCDDDLTGCEAVTEHNGIVRLLYMNAGRVMLAQCLADAILDSELWSTSPVLDSYDRVAAMGFVDHKPVVARRTITDRIGGAYSAQLEVLQSSTEFPADDSAWSTSVAFRGPVGNESIASVLGRPAVAFMTDNPDRLCYAYALKDEPRSIRDWRVCTVVEHNLVSRVEKESAQEDAWRRIMGLSFAILLITVLGVWKCANKLNQARAA